MINPTTHRWLQDCPLGHPAPKISMINPTTHRWLQDCNRCRCIAGVVACDRRACLPSPRRDERPSSFAAAPDTSRCYKPADSGPCFASFRRFRFNAENNRCEAFLYGGCAGNDNNFESASECQRTCGGDAPVLGWRRCSCAR
ncbi:hypothetical protein HAZT_HAZT012182 [Hyalella azteca]|uniref:BPTI/Kunitz inhibitor domain-containing protein n=1 Tax=Hyalella azteca TaxID=294128 RepID=A0A6A0GVV0_HYAAZ|nr:hypothetical protein HAZT_HAZT012182 [Hyalella azteca]